MAELYLFCCERRFQEAEGIYVDVIQTETGREEEILRAGRPSLDKKLCSRYMILKAVFRRTVGASAKVMFPGDTFCGDRRSRRVVFWLKQVPKLTKILGNGKFEFVPLG